EEKYIEFWSKNDAEFAEAETSPLKEDAIASFDSIARFAYNSDFAVRAKFQVLKRQKPFTFQTTGAIKQRYQKAGVLHFKIDTTTYELSAYRNLELMRMPVYENQLFVPFTDESNGNGTYEGGRYLELEIPESDSTLVDFNLVYNPYCAYSDKYSCPIPPKENNLKVGIYAGAKSPKGK
ncbi:MAG: DUF1684 domain-containing protein, partial [Bacteroidota bacterium]